MRSRKKPTKCGKCSTEESKSWHRQRGNNKFFCATCQTKKLNSRRKSGIPADGESSKNAATSSTAPEDSGQHDTTEYSSEKMSTDNSKSVKTPGTPDFENSSANDDSSLTDGADKTSMELVPDAQVKPDEDCQPTSVKGSDDNEECDMKKQKSPIMHPRLTRLRSSTRPIRAAALAAANKKQLERERQSYSRSNSAMGGNGSSSKSLGSNVSLNTAAASPSLVVPRNKSRRHIFKLAKPERAPSKRASISTFSSLWHKGQLFRESDIVAVVDQMDENMYYGMIRGLLRDEYCQQFACLTWLLPTTTSPVDRTFDPYSYILGPEDETFYPMDSLEFICHIDGEYFKSRGATLSSFATVQAEITATCAPESLNPLNQFIGIGQQSG